MKRLYVSDLEIITGERAVRDAPVNPNRLVRLTSREAMVGYAIEELRATDFSQTEHATLQAIAARLTGDERDVMERVLEVCAPRRRP